MGDSDLAATIILTATFLGIEYGLQQWLESRPRLCERLTFGSYLAFRGVHALGVFFILILTFEWDPRFIPIVLLTPLAVTAVEFLVWRMQLRIITFADSRSPLLQMFPMLTLIFLASVGAKWVDLNPSSLFHHTKDLAALYFHGLESLDNMGIAVHILAYVFLAHPANYIVRWSLNKSTDRALTDRIFASIHLGQPVPKTETAATLDPPFDNTQLSDETLQAGRVIGILERWMLVTLVLSSQYNLIGLILAAKSIARFKRMENDPNFAEYYLLGTLYSIFMALFVGLLLVSFRGQI